MNAQNTVIAGPKAAKKVFVNLVGYNAYDYYGHQAELSSEANADYAIILNSTDKIFETDIGVGITRDGVDYPIQVTKMAGFKGICFKSEDGDSISLRLIKAN